MDRLVDDPEIYPTPEDENDDDRELAGFFLVALLALTFPILVAFGFILSSSVVDDEDASAQSGSLDSVELTECPEEETESVNADPVAESQDGADSETVDTEVAGAAIEANENDAVSDTDEGGNGAESVSAQPTTQGDVAGPPGQSNANLDSPVLAQGEVVSSSPLPRDAASAADESAEPTDVNNGGERTPTSTTTTVRPPVIAGPIPPTTAPIDLRGETLAPTTTPNTQAPTTTVRPTTTTRAPTTTTTTTAPVVEPPEFSQRIDVGRIGDTSLAMRFETTASTDYTLIVRSNGAVVETVTGFAVGNQLENVTINGLTPGTDYTVQAVLDTTPSVSSPTVPFRTSGGAPEPAVEAVTLLNARVVDLQATRFEVNYESNICANGSFVIREQGGPQVGSNAGQAAGCTTRHLAVPGFWTAALKPNTTYVITITVEANGAGQGGGNTATTSLTVTTSG